MAGPHGMPSWNSLLYMMYLPVSGWEKTLASQVPVKLKLPDSDRKALKFVEPYNDYGAVKQRFQAVQNSGQYRKAGLVPTRIRG